MKGLFSWGGAHRLHYTNRTCSVSVLYHSFEPYIVITPVLYLYIDPEGSDCIDLEWNDWDFSKTPRAEEIKDAVVGKDIDEAEAFITSLYTLGAFDKLVS